MTHQIMRHNLYLIFRLGLQHENLIGYRPAGLPLEEVIISMTHIPSMSHIYDSFPQN